MPKNRKTRQTFPYFAQDRFVSKPLTNSSHSAPKHGAVLTNGKNGSKPTPSRFGTVRESANQPQFHKHWVEKASSTSLPLHLWSTRRRQSPEQQHLSGFPPKGSRWLAEQDLHQQLSEQTAAIQLKAVRGNAKVNTFHMTCNTVWNFTLS